MLKVRTIAQALDDAATGSGGFTFVRENGRELVTPFKVLRDSALAVGGALRARGLDRGDRVALLVPEADGFLTAFLGVSLAGLVPVPLAHPLDIGRLGADVEKVASFLRVARARAIVTSSRLLPSLRPLRAVAPTVELVVPWSELTGPALAASEPVDPYAPAMLQFTSGSTSRPRGVVLTHANLSANVHAICGPEGIGLGVADTGVSWLPLFHDM